MPATQKGAGEVHAVALETERRQNECIISRGEDVRQLAVSSLPLTSLYHSQPVSSVAVALVSHICFRWRDLSGLMPPSKFSIQFSLFV